MSEGSEGGRGTAASTLRSRRCETRRAGAREVVDSVGRGASVGRGGGRERAREGDRFGTPFAARRRRGPEGVWGPGATIGSRARGSHRDSARRRGAWCRRRGRSSRRRSGSGCTPAGARGRRPRPRAPPRRAPPRRGDAPRGGTPPPGGRARPRVAPRARAPRPRATRTTSWTWIDRVGRKHRRATKARGTREGMATASAAGRDAFAKPRRRAPLRTARLLIRSRKQKIGVVRRSAFKTSDDSRIDGLKSPAPREKLQGIEIVRRRAHNAGFLSALPGTPGVHALCCAGFPTLRSVNKQFFFSSHTSRLEGSSLSPPRPPRWDGRSLPTSGAC